MPQPKVRMTNPKLPGQPIWVHPQAVPVHMAAEWVEDPEPPKPPKPRPVPSAEPEPTAEDSAAPAEAAEHTPRPALRRAPKPPTSSSEE